MSTTTAVWMSTSLLALWGPADPPPSFGPISPTPVWLGE